MSEPITPRISESASLDAKNRTDAKLLTDKKSVSDGPMIAEEKLTTSADAAGKRRLKMVKGELNVPNDVAESFRSCWPWVETNPRIRLYTSNAIKSTRYTWWSFLPQNLFEQLAPWIKPANFYFLCIAVMQTQTQISTTNGRPSILLALSFVLVVSAIKDAYEDYSRYKQDREKNEAEYKVFRNGEWVKLQSQFLLVGDLIRVPENKRIPADLLTLGSGLAEGAFVYIDTKELDGETNLKPKQVPFPVQQVLKSTAEPAALRDISIDLRCDTPNDDMREWNADLTTYFKDGRTERINLNLDSLILADCVLRNTPWLLGLVVYTGDQTKIRKNMLAHLARRYKQSSIFKLTSRFLACTALVQLLICLICGIVAGALQSDGQWYLDITDSAAFTGFLRFWTWFIIVKDVVPIALYVSTELVQFFQAVFIGWDGKMVHVMNGTRYYAKAQTSRLNEECAEVRYVFSDKTGTLTQNSMDFRKCVIDGVQYGTGTTEAGIIRSAKMKMVNVIQALEDYRTTLNAQIQDPSYVIWNHVSFNERPKLVAAMRGDADENKGHTIKARNFVLCLALNNTIFPKVASDEKPDERRRSLTPDEQKEREMKMLAQRNDPNSAIKLEMDSSSPDETALAYFAQYMGVELWQRQSGFIRLRVKDANGKYAFEDYADAGIINFNSKRKRMTVLVRRVNEQKEAVGPVMIFTKGADTNVKKVLVKSGDGNPLGWSTIEKKLSEFGGESLRCLVLGYAEKPASWWYEGFKPRLDEKIRTQGPEEKNHESGACSAACGMCKLEEEIELSAGCDALGVTAIEDKLQEGVPDALKKLLMADIKVWVLTGDTVDTAINIGVSCNLLEADMLLNGSLFLFDKDLGGKEEKIIARIEQSQQFINKNVDHSIENFGIALHGDVWKTLVNSQTDILKRFFDLASQCKSVIACRLEPKEKAGIVRLMREREKVPCLAIGDGNNDTPMIKMADIGVGIRGVEGTSAVAASDYAISQFRFLTRLLMVYGRLNSRRIAQLVHFVFYKAAVLVWSMIFFGCYSQFSGQFLYLDWAYEFHNLFYTSLAIIIFAIFDWDLSAETLEDNPQFYAITRGPKWLTAWTFLRYLAFSFIHGVIAFFVPWYGWLDNPVPNGLVDGAWSRGLVVYTCVVLISNLKLLYLFRQWHWVSIGAWITGPLSFFIMMIIFASDPVFIIGGVDYTGLIYFLFGTARYYFVVILACTMAALVDFTYEACTRVFYPTVTDVFVEAERLHKPLSFFRDQGMEEGARKATATRMNSMRNLAVNPNDANIQSDSTSPDVPIITSTQSSSKSGVVVAMGLEDSSPEPDNRQEVPDEDVTHA